MTVAFNLPHYPMQPTAKFKDGYADLPMPRQAYARMISSVDDHIGRVLDKLDATGGRGGVIALDRQGHYQLAFNTEGMYRGVVQGDGPPQISIYRD